MEMRSSGGVLRGVVTCRRHRRMELVDVDVEVWSSAALANCLSLLKFLAFVPQGSWAKHLRFASPATLAKL